MLTWCASVLIAAYGQTLQEKLTQKVTLGIRNDVIDSLDYISFEEFKRNGASTYVAKLTTDMNLIEENLISNQLEFLTMLVKIVGSGIALFSFHSSLVIAVLFLACIMFVVPALFYKKIEVANQKVSEALDKVIDDSTHWLKGFQIIRNYQKFDYFKSKIIVCYQNLYHAKVNNTKNNALIGSAIGILNIISQLAIILISGYLSFKNIIPIGSILTTGNLTGGIFNSLSMLVVVVADITAGKVVYSKLPIIEKEKEDKRVELRSDMIEKIEVKDLVYTFENGKSISYPDIILENNKNYALVEKSGCGKSTLLNILSGRYTQYSGEIKINGINLKDISRRSIENMSRYVEQETYIFNASVAENVTMMHENFYDEGTLIKSLERSQVYTCMSDLEDGIDTDLSTDVLSGGEAQRLNLARCFLDIRPLALLDEITANCDIDNAINITKNISEIKDCLKVTITHNKNILSLGYFDEIIDLTS